MPMNQSSFSGQSYHPMDMSAPGTDPIEAFQKGFAFVQNIVDRKQAFDLKRQQLSYEMMDKNRDFDFKVNTENPLKQRLIESQINHQEASAEELHSRINTKNAESGMLKEFYQKYGALTPKLFDGSITKDPEKLNELSNTIGELKSTYGFLPQAERDIKDFQGILNKRMSGQTSFEQKKELQDNKPSKVGINVGGVRMSYDDITKSLNDPSTSPIILKQLQSLKDPNGEIGKKADPMFTLKEIRALKERKIGKEEPMYIDPPTSMNPQQSSATSSPSNRIQNYFGIGNP